MRRSVAKAMVVGIAASTIVGPTGGTVFAAELENSENSSELNTEISENVFSTISAENITDTSSSSVETENGIIDETVESNIVDEDSTETVLETEAETEAETGAETAEETVEESLQTSEAEANASIIVADSAVLEAQEAVVDAVDAAEQAQAAATEAADAVETTTQSEAASIIAEAEDSIETAEESFNEAKTEYENALAAYEQAKAEYEVAVASYDTAAETLQSEINNEMAEQEQQILEKQEQIASLETEITELEKQIAQTGAEALVTAEENGTSDVESYLTAVIQYYYLPNTISLAEGQKISSVTVSKGEDDGDSFVVVTYSITNEDGSVDTVSMNLGYSVDGDNLSLYERETKYEYTDETGSYSKSEDEMEAMVDEGTAVVRYLYNGTYYTKEAIDALNLSEEEQASVSTTYVVLGDWSEATVEGKDATTYTSYTLNGTTKTAVASKEVVDSSKDSTTVTYFDADGNYVQVVTNYTTKYVYKYVNGEQIYKKNIKDLETAKSDINDTLSQLNDEYEIYNYYWIIYYTPNNHNYEAYYYLDYVYRETTATQDSYTETSINDSTDATAVMRNGTAIFNNNDGEYTYYIAYLKQLLSDYQSKKEELATTKAEVENIESTIENLQNKYDSIVDLDAALLANISYWETRLAEAQASYEAAEEQLDAAKDLLAQTKAAYDEKYKIQEEKEDSEEESEEEEEDSEEPIIATNQTTSTDSTTTSYLIAEIEEELDESTEEEELDEEELEEELQQIFNNSSHTNGGASSNESTEDNQESEEEVPEDVVVIEEEEVPMAITAAGLLKRAWWGVFIAAPATGAVGVVILEGKRRAAEIAAELIDK